MSPVASEVSKQLFLGLASFVISVRVFCTIATFTLAYRRQWMAQYSSAALSPLL